MYTVLVHTKQPNGGGVGTTPNILTPDINLSQCKVQNII